MKIIRDESFTIRQRGIGTNRYDEIASGLPLQKALKCYNKNKNRYPVVEMINSKGVKIFIMDQYRRQKIQLSKDRKEMKEKFKKLFN